MPLVPFSKILSSKTFARNSQLYSSSTVTVGASASATDSTSQQQQQQQHRHHNVDSSSLRTSPSPPNSANSLNNKSVVNWKGSTGRTRERSSKAFTFSLDPFNVVASLRTRSSKTKSVHSSHPESTTCSSSRSVSHQSHSLAASVYSGYEDHEYGDPEVNAEEIRRPSGLGRRASIPDMDMSTEMGDEVTKYQEVEQGFVRELRSADTIPEETESRNSVSDTSDSESLSEIRYPSGLGNIKLATLSIHDALERPPSTYPLFEPSVPYYDTCPENHDTSTPTATSPCSPTPDPALASPPSPLTPRLPSICSTSASSCFSTLLPILFPYLPLQTLTSFARVDRSVGKVARDLLWRSIHMSVTIRSAQNPTGNTTKNKKGKMRISIDGHANGSNIDTQKLLDVICTCAASEGGTTGEEDVARLVKSLEMTCRLDCSAPVYLRSSLSQRSRPPPLVLVLQNAKPLVRSRSPIPDPGQGAELAPTPSSPVPVLSEPRSVRQISPNNIPGAHSVNESALHPQGTNGEQNVTASHADVVDVTPSSNKKLNRASLILRNSALTLRSMAHAKSNSTSKTALPKANSTFIPTCSSNSTSRSSSPSKSNKTIHTNVPDALHSPTTTVPAAKPRPTSMRLPQSLSLFKSRSAELVGQTAGALSSQTQNPSTSSSEGADADTPISVPPFFLFTRAPDTRWTAPPEWDRIAAVATANPSVPPSPPSSAPLPGTTAGTRWSPPPEWHANSSLSFPPTSFRTTSPTTNLNPFPVRSAPALLTRSPSFSANLTAHSHSHPDLHFSASLPSLRAPTSPHLPSRSRSRSSCYADDAPSPTPLPSSPGIMTTVPSPITPYSAISLSAFPLPPPGTMPCLPAFPPEYASGFVASSQAPSPILSGSRSWSPSPSLAMSTSTPPTSAHTTTTTATFARDDAEESDLSPELAAALKKMVNLEHVTVKYISDSEYSADTGTPSSAQSPYTSMREASPSHHSIHLSLVKKANETLGNVLPNLESLRSLTVVCQAAPYDEVCRGWWEEATRSLENFKLNVTCLPGC